MKKLAMVLLALGIIAVPVLSAPPPPVDPGKITAVQRQYIPATEEDPAKLRAGVGFTGNPGQEYVFFHEIQIVAEISTDSESVTVVASMQGTGLAIWTIDLPELFPGGTGWNVRTHMYNLSGALLSSTEWVTIQKDPPLALKKKDVPKEIAATYKMTDSVLPALFDRQYIVARPQALTSLVMRF